MIMFIILYIRSLWLIYYLLQLGTLNYHHSYPTSHSHSLVNTVLLFSFFTGLTFFGFHIWAISYNICLSPSDFPYLAWVFQWLWNHKGHDLCSRWPHAIHMHKVTPVQWSTHWAPVLHVPFCILSTHWNEWKFFLSLGNLLFLEVTKTLTNDSMCYFKWKRWAQVAMGAQRRKSTWKSF